MHYDEAEQTIYVEPGREMGTPGICQLTPICGEPAVSLVQAEEWLAKRAPQYVLIALCGQLRKIWRARMWRGTR